MFRKCLSFPAESKWWSLRQDREFKVILSYRAFEAALSYLTPDLKKRQKLGEMRGVRGEEKEKAREAGESGERKEEQRTPRGHTG